MGEKTRMIGSDSLHIVRVSNGFFISSYDENRALIEELVARQPYELSDIVREWAIPIEEVEDD